MAKPKKGSNVQVPSVGERILSGLGELKEAIDSKEPLNRRFTVRTVELDLEPQMYSSKEISEIRDRLGTSQAIFAKLLGVSVSLVQAWEQGKREPQRPIRRLMDEIASDPDKWIARLKAACESKLLDV